MKIIHTSDWHLGRRLAGKRRYHEFEAFLNWLLDKVEAEQVDGLLIAGDVFDKTTPSPRAQELYYDFLAKVAQTCCGWVVVIGGNHDSPYFLQAAQKLLQGLKIYVIASPSAHIEDEILVLKNDAGVPQLIVCAVPYLRDRDVRTVEAGESMEDKGSKLKAGIAQHYRDVAQHAEQTRAQLKVDVPIIAMGHLFTHGAQTVDGDGVRELYVGTLAHLSSDIFAPSFRYVALGHLHVAQQVAGSKRVFYCGSPIPMGFGEAEHIKRVALIQLTAHDFYHKEIEIPVFQQLKRVRGDWDAISAQIHELAAVQSTAWLEVIYEGDKLMANLRERLRQELAGTGLELIIIKNKAVLETATEAAADEQTLDELSCDEVFEELLVRQQLPEEQRVELRDTYRELLDSMTVQMDNSSR